MDFASTLEAFRLQKSIKISIDFGIDFWKALKSIRDPEQSNSAAQDPRLRTPKGVLTGLHTVVQLSEGLGFWNRGLVLGILHAVCRWHGEFQPLRPSPQLLGPPLIFLHPYNQILKTNRKT